MKCRKHTVLFTIFFLLILTAGGIIFSTRAERHKEQGGRPATASTGNALELESKSRDDRELGYRLSLTLVEPLLLLMLGTLLLGVAMGVNLVRSKRPALQLQSAASRASTTKAEKFGAHESKVERKKFV